MSKYLPLILVLQHVALAQPKPEERGWTRASLTSISESGVEVFRRGYKIPPTAAEYTSWDYATIVNLSRATIGSMRGSTGPIDADKGPRILCFSLDKFWNHAVGLNTDTLKAIAVTNGTFFEMHHPFSKKGSGAYPEWTFMTLGLKQEGKVISYGLDAEITKYGAHLRLFCLGNKSASIEPHVRGVFDDGQWANAAPVFDDGWPVDANVGQGRSLVGVADTNGDGMNETVIFLSCERATHMQAWDTLREFNISSGGMLDSGGSTGIVVDGEVRIRPHLINFNKLPSWFPNSRLLPHAFAIYGRFD